MNLIATRLKAAVVHYIGNKSQDQGYFLSKKEIEAPVDLAERLTSYFTAKFDKSHDRFRFHHPDSLQFNVVYQYATMLFDNKETLHEISRRLALHLYECTMHPKINPGELFICHFEDCLIDNQQVNALGIFKTENKSGFFELVKGGEGFEVLYKDGIDLSKLDKGCLVVDKGRAEGYEVMLVDQSGRSIDTQYWKDDFLGLEVVNTEYRQTNQFLGMAKTYLTSQMPEEFQVSKTDQIDLLNRSVDYFKKRDEFDRSEFEREVLQDEAVISSFKNFDSAFRQANDVDIEDHFEISIPAVKRQARVFKSVLKLDKNFHIYIHGNRDLIEQGIDADGRKYYKIYYKEEA